MELKSLGQQLFCAEFQFQWVELKSFGQQLFCAEFQFQWVELKSLGQQLFCAEFQFQWVELKSLGQQLFCAEFQFQWVELKSLGQQLFCAEEDSVVTPGVTDPLRDTVSNLSQIGARTLPNSREPPQRWMVSGRGQQRDRPLQWRIKHYTH